MDAAADDFDDDDDLVADVPSSGQMVEDTGALDCSVCCLPLKPPIFQCIHGHVVCDACHDKLKAAGKGRCAVSASAPKVRLFGFRSESATSQLRLRVAAEESEIEAEVVARDVGLVVSRASVSRAEAIMALKESGGDAILELTSS